MNDEIYYVEDAEKEIRNYIDKHFKLLLPFEVHRGYSFQIIINKERYEELSEETKGTLRDYAELPKRSELYSEDSEEEKLWLQENYWVNCKAYIFGYTEEDSYLLEARCNYGHEGREDSYTILFFNISDFPKVICENHDCSERDEFKEFLENS